MKYAENNAMKRGEGLEDTLPISLICDFIFCPRRAWLEIQGEKIESLQMERGFHDHRAVDDANGGRGDTDYRAVNVNHQGWGLSGRLDAVRLNEDNGVIIREYKATPVRRSMDVTHAMRIQLALQAACMEDMGYRVDGTEIFFTSHHRIVPVELRKSDYEEAYGSVQEVRKLIECETAPLPFEDDPRCMRCSHAGICLPEERAHNIPEHRIMVKVPNHAVTHLATPGARAYLKSGRMHVSKNGDEITSVPLDSIQALQIHGNVDVSSGLMRELMWRNIPILWCSGTGRLMGWSVSSYGPNGETRVAQHVASHEGRLDLAREFISAKIHNQIVLLRRSDKNNNVLFDMKHIEKSVVNANRIQDILSLEGQAAALYFSQFHHLISVNKRNEWPWLERMRHPAPDPLNALLDYTYSLLLSDCIRAIVSCGLDAHAGFLHSSKRNKPALALDLMEEFRAPIADSVVQTVVNNGEIKRNGFANVMGSVRLRDETRKTLIGAYERRMATELKHPVYAYRASWRRIVEIQARMVLGRLEGSLERYRGIRVR
ncbi:CRISPR-associated endonuclease Cas4/Cas1 [Bifidobacterium animalis]|uniref:CRISPR-associated endonuclease Cas4/Cas1 n=1 Tax=Bifidobacterium animalis TaxID=28025 RepID=UPI0002F95D55|nr:CRISPR-associated endonuclease Cas4/Cas1 [Bifidobacterium animalis]